MRPTSLPVNGTGRTFRLRSLRFSSPAATALQLPARMAAPLQGAAEALPRQTSGGGRPFILLGSAVHLLANHQEVFK